MNGRNMLGLWEGEKKASSKKYCVLSEGRPVGSKAESR